MSALFKAEPWSPVPSTESSTMLRLLWACVTGGSLRPLAIAGHEAELHWGARGQRVLVLNHAGADLEALRRRIAHALDVWTFGGLHLVVVGGGDPARSLMKSAGVFWQLRRQISFHHLDDDGTLRKISGHALPPLEEAVRAMVGQPQSISLEQLHAQAGHQMEAARVGVDQTSAFNSDLLGAKLPATRALLGICIALFFLEANWGALSSASVPVLARMGADYGPLTWGQHQWWRLLTSAFLHVSLVHVAFNLLALSALGRFFEPVLGARRFLVLYLLAALGGAVASSVVHPHLVSAGASAGLWGLLAAQVGLVFNPRGLIPDLILQRMRQRVWQPLLINVGVSFIPHVDWVAHLGGGLVGLALVGTGLLTRELPPMGERDPGAVEPGPVRIAATVLGAAVVVALGFGMIQQRPWLLTAPNRVAQVSLQDGLSIELPELIAAPATQSVSEGWTQFQFGHEGVDPVAVTVSVNPAGQAPAQAETALAALQDRLAKRSFPGLQIEKLAIEQHAGRPTLIWQAVGSSLRAQEAFTVVGGHAVRIDTWTHTGGSADWRDAAARIIETLQHNSSSTH